MVLVLLFLVRTGFTGIALTLTLLAIGAFLGFAHPFLDALNHFQPLLFVGTLVCLLLTAFVFAGDLPRALVMALCATGFLASSVTFVPEAVSGWTLQQLAVPAGQRTYRLMSHNLFGKNYAMGISFAAIENENPDILALQEYFPEQRVGLHRRLLPSYPYFKLCFGGRRGNIAIYAKMPFSAELSGSCINPAEFRTGRIVATFTTETGDTFKVATTHFDWPLQLSKFWYRDTASDAAAASIVRQRDQWRELASGINAQHGPILLVGDLNSTGWSYAVRRFGLETAMERWTRNMWTYPKKFFVGEWRDTPAILPLDHLFTRGGVQVHSIASGDAAGSDHLPILAEFSIGKVSR